MMQEQIKELQRFKKDTAYFEKHRDELLGKYPEQWVAIFNEKVAGASVDLEQLLTDLEQHAVPIEKALIEHVSAKDELLILPS